MEKNEGILGQTMGFLTKLLNGILAILLALMVIIVFSNVIGRYFLGSSLAWSEEVSRFLFIWLVFFGAILAYINDEHLALDILTKVLPKKGSQLIAVIADLLVIYALSLITIGGYKITVENMTWLSPAASIPYGYVYIVVPFTGSILIIQAVLKIFRHVKALFSSSVHYETPVDEVSLPTKTI
ncbi:TRAP transporter small permease [Desulfosporosinus sp. BICA1-9]|uniref:TRAP transporter small permease n=1 Tax=Desulfosporosinus sp. BICA1-9 TaxID=1531958 RepID=UPI000A74C0E9|nr:TRAP transporter small permease [Desulfosporosinus sp. BICA1-9]